MMRKIILHGRLAEEFGPEFDLDVFSPSEALRALCIMVKGFRASLREGHYRIIRGKIENDFSLNADKLPLGLGTAKELHIVPVVAGSGWLVDVLIGVTLIAAAVLAPIAIPAFAAGGALAGTFAGLSITGVVGAVGVGLALSGIAQLLAPAQNAAQDQLPSYLFGGLSNVTTQGGPVPLVYGIMRVGSVMISASFNTEAIGGFGTAGLPDGGIKEF